MALHFEYNPEKLIDEVKKRPALWDVAHEDYKSKPVRCSLWNDIVAEMIRGNNDLSKTDLRELEIQVQKKWKSLRDCFTKSLVNQKKSKRPYVYHRQLKFLLNRHKNSKQDQTSSDTDEENEERVKRTWRKQTIKLSRDDSDNEGEYNDTTENLEMEIAPMASMSGGKPFGDDFMFANVDAARAENEDPDKMFLLSLLPHLKEVPEQFRLNVKMDMMHVLRDASYMQTDRKKII